jgi:hypothetical protein
MNIRTREFGSIGDGHYRLSLLAEGVIFDVTRLRWERGELLGVLAVSADFAGAKVVDGVLSIGTFNLTSVSARTTRAKELASRANAPELDFGQALEELCQRTIRAEEAGRPLILLRNVEPLPFDFTDVIAIDGFPILRRHPSILFADGGTGKSTLALYFAGELERRGVSTLYLDWEMDEYDHRKQLERLFGSDMPDVKYRRCERPLVIEAEGIADQVRQCGIEFVMCDSIVMACDGPPEAAEVASRYFRALRQLEVGSLNLAHVTKGEGNDKRPFGSTFWHNGARACWYAEQADAAPSDRIHIGIFNRKFSRGSRPAALGFDIEYGRDDGPIVIHSADVADNDQLSTKLPLSSRMRHLLKGGPLTIAKIAGELNAKVETVDKTARRHDGKLFTRVPGSDGIYRIALVESRSAA